MTELPFAYKGEAQLVRWSETPKGRTVTLLLDPFVGEQHPFKALKCGESGQRMQIAAVLVGDDDQPVPPKRNGTEGASGTAPCVRHAGTSEGQDKPRTYTRSQRAALMCQDKEFEAWLRTQCERRSPDYRYGMTANEALKALLGISSKRDLDTEGPCADGFDRLMTDYSVRGIVR